MEITVGSRGHIGMSSDCTAIDRSSNHIAAFIFFSFLWVSDHVSVRVMIRVRVSVVLVTVFHLFSEIGI